jgi:hypothetical protein
MLWTFLLLLSRKNQRQARSLDSVIQRFATGIVVIVRIVSFVFSHCFMQTNHKEGIRIASRGENIAKNIPEPLFSDLDAISEACDKLALPIMAILSKKLFSFTYTEDLAEAANLPSNPVCMIDIAHYFNDSIKKDDIKPPKHGSSVRDVNCVPHTDPGLLSISFLSSAEGLQMQDPVKDVWISGPNSWLDSQRNLGVLWLGEAARIASKGKFIPGVHRVIYPKSKGDRLTMWFEMCTKTQLKGPSEMLIEKDGEILIPSLQGNNSKQKVKKGDAMADILWGVEHDMGVPMSKTLYEPADYVSHSNPLHEKKKEPSSSSCSLL